MFQLFIKLRERQPKMLNETQQNMFSSSTKKKDIHKYFKKLLYTQGGDLE